MCRALTLHRVLSVLFVLSISSGPGFTNAINSSTSISSPHPTVSLRYATYSGIPFFDAATNATNTHFLGMRYAAPPTGSLRWAAPQPPRTTRGVQRADRQPVQCLQSGFGSSERSPFRDDSTSGAVSARTAGEVFRRGELKAEPDASEDCLFLKYVLFPQCHIRVDLSIYRD